MLELLASMSGNKYEKNKQYREKGEGKQIVTYAWIIQ